MLRPALACAVVSIVFALSSLPAQAAFSLLPQAEPAARPPQPPPGASVEQLTERGDELRAEKILSGAIEYYRAALAKSPDSASLHNRIGIVELELARWKNSVREFELAIRSDPEFADAYNNLGVDYYEMKKLGKAIAFYKKAIRLQGTEASFYSNLGAAYFSRKDFEKAAAAYTTALQLDPDVLEHTSRTGVAARLPSPMITPASTMPWPSSTPKWDQPTIPSNTFGVPWKKAISKSTMSTKMKSSPACARIRASRS